MAGKPRYYLIACGTSNYNDQDVDNLDSVPTDLQRVVDLFIHKFGYEEALTNLRLNPNKNELIKQFSDWLQHEERCESDRVIFYYSGHGEDLKGDRHYLLMEETDYNQLPQTSLPTEDLVRPLNNEGVNIEQILYIIDSCYSGVGISDVSKFTTQVVQKYQSVGGAGIAVHGIAACRAKDTAKEDVFSRGLEQVLNDLSKNYGNLYIPLDYIVDQINQIISSEQRASYSASGSEKSAKFFPILP
ncbi:MAG: caspase family protein, partial [Moorea sp. SIO1F2]|uniref:caspase family protein n=1 Tax=Moorena sp. SIO1F2 TaxID=2607819 RepID=UPI0013BCACA1